MFKLAKLSLFVVLFFSFVLLPDICLAQNIEWAVSYGTGKSADYMKRSQDGYWHTEKFMGTVWISHTCFNIGAIKTGWIPDTVLGTWTGNTNSENYFSVQLHVPSQAPLEFCLLPEKIRLESIKDPSVFQYTKAGHSVLTYELFRKVNGKEVLVRRSSTPLPTNTRMRHVTTQTAVGGPLEVKCGRNEVILLKLGNNYGGLKAQDIKIALRTEGGGTMVGGVMEYKTAYWFPKWWSNGVAQRTTQNE